MNHLDRIYTSDPGEFARRYLSYLHQIFSGIDIPAVERFIDGIMECRNRGKTIFFIGNGGSAATASHFANDLSIGSKSSLKPIRALSLTDNAAILTALANDVGYDHIFVRQLMILGKAGDLLVGISASGNSPNLIHAFEYAATAGIRTFALTAFDGGKLKRIADDGIHILTEPGEYGPAEDAHMVLDHLTVSYLARRIQNKNLSD